MINKIPKFMVAVVLLCVCSFASTTQAVPVTVDYSVSGSSGNYTLNFTVANNMPSAANNLYFFGVQLSARDITGSPGPFDPNEWTSWDNSAYGGSATIYNNNWIDYSLSGISGAGTSLAGFTVHITDAVAPSSVAWFAYTYGGPNYTGGDNFNLTYNPGFEGTGFQGSATVPDGGATLLLMGLAASGLAACRRLTNRQTSQVG